MDCCGYFGNCCNFFKIGPPFSSSTAHRNAERFFAMAELSGSALQYLRSEFIIPKSIVQTVISGYSILRSDTHAYEKVIHFLQASVAIAQFCLASQLIFSHSNCDVSASLVCTALAYTQVILKGFLPAGWGPSEFSKDPYTDPTRPPAVIHHHNAPIPPHQVIEIPASVPVPVPVPTIPPQVPVGRVVPEADPDEDIEVHIQEPASPRSRPHSPRVHHQSPEKRKKKGPRRESIFLTYSDAASSEDDSLSLARMP